MLRILDYTWHQAHSYRLHWLPAEFAYVAWRPVLWNESQRPVPPNFLGPIVPDDVHLAEWDLALLHLDQWCDQLNLRALPFRLHQQLTRGLPQVCIMHGTPEHELNRRRILRLLGDMPVVCNSHQAVLEWDGGENRLDRHGRPQFRTIVHGYDPTEWWSRPVEARRLEVRTVSSGGTLSREYHGLSLLERLQRDVPLVWMGSRGNTDWCDSYDEYRELLATTLIYFNPSRRGPMPGARTEAMLAGCCTVTVPGNDVEQYVKRGWPGIVLVESYAEARDVLRYLLAHPAEAWELGQQARRTAAELFNAQRFVADWLAYLEDLLS